MPNTVDNETLRRGLSGEANPFEVLVALVHDLRGDDDEPCFVCGHTFASHELGEPDDDPEGFEPFCNDCDGPADSQAEGPRPDYHRFEAFPELWGRERFACCGAWSHEGHAADGKHSWEKAAPPEGVIVLSLDDPGTVHDTIREALGE